ncbi:MAG: DUF559 domain-containing protein [Clostridia bacterium]|nr:DUF559 domain-containing protein [Clostridia bacterium]
MIYKYNKELVSTSQKLRKEMTREEKHLWYDFLKKLPFTVNRQKNIGNYIVDFYVSSKNTVIEIDGSQHFREENKLQDEQRDSDLKKLGLRIIRYKNIDINRNFESVCKDILERLNVDINDLKK